MQDCRWQAPRLLAHQEALGATQQGAARVRWHTCAGIEGLRAVRRGRRIQTEYEAAARRGTSEQELGNKRYSYRVIFIYSDIFATLAEGRSGFLLLL